MEQHDRNIGICPHCDETKGGVGDPCTNRLCNKKGYHLIRSDQMTKAREEAERKHVDVDPILGKRISKYILVGKLGEGGMGAVYRALQMPLRREVALKIISASDIDDIALKRFAREASAMSLLEHPNIVKLYDFGPENSKESMPYMVLELVSGRTLRQEMEKRRREGSGWKHDDLRKLFKQVLSGLETAHRAGLFHRDIKPDNIMLTTIVGDSNHVKILDFGLARAVEQLQGIEKLSKTGMLMGTPAFMAPEQFLVQKTGDVDYRVDLYATAVLMFELLLGKKPFVARTWKEIASFKLSPNYSPLRELQGMVVPKRIEVFLTKALAREPEERFQNAMEMFEAFDQMLEAESKALECFATGHQWTVPMQGNELRLEGAHASPLNREKQGPGIPDVESPQTLPLVEKKARSTDVPVLKPDEQHLKRVAAGSTKQVQSTTRPLSGMNRPAASPHGTSALNEAPAVSVVTPLEPVSPIDSQAATPNEKHRARLTPKKSYDAEPLPDFGRRKLVGVAITVVAVAIVAWTVVWFAKADRDNAGASLEQQTSSQTALPPTPSGVSPEARLDQATDRSASAIIEEKAVLSVQPTVEEVVVPKTPDTPAPKAAVSKTPPKAATKSLRVQDGAPTKKAPAKKPPAKVTKPKPRARTKATVTKKPKAKPEKKAGVSKELDEMLDMDL